MLNSLKSTPEATVRAALDSIGLSKLRVLGNSQYFSFHLGSGYLSLQVPNKAGCQPDLKWLPG